MAKLLRAPGIVRVTAITVLLAVLPSFAYACACLEQGTVREQFIAADAVFIGRIVAIEIEKHKFDGGETENMIATFEVSRRWKGPRKARIRVGTCGTQTTWCSCGANFALGESYVVVARGKSLATGSCDLTEQLESAEGLVGEIEAIAQAVAAGRS